MKEILEKLTNKGFDAYIVGGYVRDNLLNIKSFDIDICTNASIESIIKIFGHIGKAYKEYYTYHIKDGLYNYEITTFRRELEYKNNKPTKLLGINDLYTDLLRRDFTINTLCLDKDNNLIDLLNGKKDLDNHIIRTVGDTYDKLCEDNTRILRAIKYASILDFDIDNEIKCFIKEKGYLLNNLTKEYIKSELDIIFKSNPIKFFKLVEEFNIKEYLDLEYENIIKTKDYYGVWAQINHNYSLKKEEKSIVSSIKKLVNKKSITPYDIYLYGEIVSINASNIINIDISDIINSIPIKSVLDIDITFNELIKYINKNRINEIIRLIEKNIVNNNIKNNKCDIIRFIKENYNE